jgi:hypothetical protein
MDTTTGARAKIAEISIGSGRGRRSVLSEWPPYANQAADDGHPFLRPTDNGSHRRHLAAMMETGLPQQRLA